MCLCLKSWKWGHKIKLSAPSNGRRGWRGEEKEKRRGCGGGGGGEREGGRVIWFDTFRYVLPSGVPSLLLEKQFEILKLGESIEKAK